MQHWNLLNNHSHSPISKKQQQQRNTRKKKRSRTENQTSECQGGGHATPDCTVRTNGANGWQLSGTRRLVRVKLSTAGPVMRGVPWLSTVMVPATCREPDGIGRVGRVGGGRPGIAQPPPVTNQRVRVSSQLVRNKHHPICLMWRKGID